jgi:hypothetical protein
MRIAAYRSERFFLVLRGTTSKKEDEKRNVETIDRLNVELPNCDGLSTKITRSNWFEREREREKGQKRKSQVKDGKKTRISWLIARAIAD